MTDLYRTIHGSAHDIPLPDASVHCIVTSPPYWGLRAYAGEQGVEWPSVTYRLNEWTEPVTVPGCDPACAHEWGDELPPHHPGQVEQTKWKNAEAAGKGQTASKGAYCIHCGGWRGGLGLEPSPVEYIGHLILCLREWRRVLRDDGVAWVKLGDSYNGSGGAGGDYNAGGLRDGQPRYGRKDSAGLKPKDLCMIPAMFAMAARADGWWLRSDVIWAKPNPMPESVTDRPTNAHEHVFLLAKAARYFYDADAVREASVNPEGSAKRYESAFFVGPKHESGNYSVNGATHTAGMKQFDGGRNLRNVWRIATQPTPFAHFATYPEKLVEPCIRAGTSARGCCPECGAPWERVVERDVPENYEGKTGRWGNSGNGMRMVDKWNTTTTTTGWRPTCECEFYRLRDDIAEETRRAIEEELQNVWKGNGCQTIQI